MQVSLEINIKKKRHCSTKQRQFEMTSLHRWNNWYRTGTNGSMVQQQSNQYNIRPNCMLLRWGDYVKRETYTGVGLYLRSKNAFELVVVAQSHLLDSFKTTFVVGPCFSIKFKGILVRTTASKWHQTESSSKYFTIIHPTKIIMKSDF